MDSAAPRAKEMPSGSRNSRDWSMAIASAMPPQAGRPTTRSPTAQPLTPAPSAVIVPATSQPGAKGRGGKRGPVDRGALTLDGRRAGKARRRDDDYVPPPPPMPVITHRRSRLKIIPPETPPEG